MRVTETRGEGAPTCIIFLVCCTSVNCGTLRSHSERNTSASSISSLGSSLKLLCVSDTHVPSSVSSEECGIWGPRRGGFPRRCSPWPPVRCSGDGAPTRPARREAVYHRRRIAPQCTGDANCAAADTAHLNREPLTLAPAQLWTRPTEAWAAIREPKGRPAARQAGPRWPIGGPAGVAALDDAGRGAGAALVYSMPVCPLRCNTVRTHGVLARAPRQRSLDVPPAGVRYPTGRHTRASPAGVPGVAAAGSALPVRRLRWPAGPLVQVLPRQMTTQPWRRRQGGTIIRVRRQLISCQAAAGFLYCYFGLPRCGGSAGPLPARRARREYVRLSTCWAGSSPHPPAQRSMPSAPPYSSQNVVVGQHVIIPYKAWCKLYNTGKLQHRVYDSDCRTGYR